MMFFVSLGMGATTTASQAPTPSKAPSKAPTAAAAARTAPTPAKVTTASVRHTVLKGENLFRIALSYGITVGDLCRANGIKDEDVVTEGQVLSVPIKRATALISPPATASARRSPSSGAMNAALPGSRTAPQLIKMANRTVISNLDDVGPDPAEVESEEIPPSDASPKAISYSLIPSDEPFSWPVQDGIVRSPFGMRHGRQHAGIDICAPSGTPIYAARDGVVSYSGHKFRGYGNVVMIDHGDGFTTVYAHNTANLVREGDPVVRGQIIARVGATGNATGAHCHFEIRNDDVCVDPRGYLAESPEDDVIFAKGIPPGTPPLSKQAALPKPDVIP